MSDRETIIKKIRALRARAADGASTESEAAIAARIAAKLLEEHNLSLSELDLKAEGVDHQGWGKDGRRAVAPEHLAAMGIAKLCGVKVWKTGNRLNILGVSHDVEAALYFLDLTRNAIRLAWKEEKASLGYNDASYCINFKKGVASRLGERFRDLAIEQERARASTGTGLVVVKDALINQWLAEKKMKFGKPGQVSVGNGFHAGKHAGNSVAINRGVGHGGGARALG
jgi:hypothetical protein